MCTSYYFHLNFSNSKHCTLVIGIHICAQRTAKFTSKLHIICQDAINIEKLFGVRIQWQKRWRRFLYIFGMATGLCENDEK